MVKLLLSALRWAGVFGLNIASGGGGGKTPANTTQTVISDVAPWAREAAKETLAKGMELTEQGYEQYGGNRLAGFDPMQQQSYTDAQNMGVAPQIGTATQMATQAGQYNPADFQNQYNNQLQQYTGANVDQYMNPFLQGALAPQIREAASAGMQAQNLNAAKAVGMGAFGGTRGALQQSMTEKNTLQNMADINARGYSDAFNQAAGMFSADQQRKMQDAQLRAQYGLSADQAREQSRQFGSTAGLNAAQVLSTLGGQQFQQGMDINKLRNTYGAQRQAQDQRGLDIGYQDWMNQKNFDWDQIMRRSDLLRAVPSGSSSTTSMYSAGPSTAQNLAAAGTAAAGASQLFARGGLAYADGGITSGGITGDDNVAAIVPMLSNEQLKQAYDIAVRMGDPERIRVIAEEMQKRGVGAEGGTGQAVLPAMAQPPEAPAEQIAPNSISAMASQDMVNNIVPTQESMANGGIVAFARGGGSSEDEYEDDREDRYLESPGIPEQYRRVALRTADAFDQFDNLKEPTPLTDEQRRASIIKERDEMRDLAGPSPYAPMREKLAAREAKIGEQEKKGLGVALLGAAGNLLQGSNLSSGLSNALPKFAGEYGQNLKESGKQRDAIEEYQYQLADAEYKQSIGDIKGAQESIRLAEAAKLAAVKEKRTTLLNRGTVGAKLAQALKPIGRGSGSGSGRPAQVKLAEQLAAAEIAFEKDPTPANQQIVDALRRTMDRTKDIPAGGTREGLELARISATITRDEEEAVKGQRFRNPAYMEAMSEQNQEKMDAADRAALETIRARSRNPAAVNPNSAKSATVPSKTLKAPPGSKLGKKTPLGTEVFLDGELIGHLP